jgi:hypothetical protein
MVQQSPFVVVVRLLIEKLASLQGDEHDPVPAPSSQKPVGLAPPPQVSKKCPSHTVIWLAESTATSPKSRLVGKPLAMQPSTCSISWTVSENNCPLLEVIVVDPPPASTARRTPSPVVEAILRPVVQLNTGTVCGIGGGVTVTATEAPAANVDPFGLRE